MVKRAFDKSTRKLHPFGERGTGQAYETGTSSAKTDGQARTAAEGAAGQAGRRDAPKVRPYVGQPGGKRKIHDHGRPMITGAV